MQDAAEKMARKFAELEIGKQFRQVITGTKSHRNEKELYVPQKMAEISAKMTLGDVRCTSTISKRLNGGWGRGGGEVE